ncbi:hippocalcin-like protein 1 [Diadema antillarum]|uniref:hippocalcin-like protein 1 n=1 Tax=Diadema antillarum TaxID=105358 RepID=UPI003A87C937
MGSSPPSKLSPQEVTDLHYQTNFSKEEINEWYSMFLQESPKGQMCKEEFGQLYTRVFPEGTTGSFTNNVFRTFDKDSNGFIDFNEFIIGMGILSRGSYHQKLAWVFSLYDIDDDGFITKSEMTEMIKAKLQMVGDTPESLPKDFKNCTPEAVSDKVFDQIDTDGDGQITLSEFLDGVTKSPSLIALLH